MNTRKRNKITQTTGARVLLENEAGMVVGHYDDDIVFVRFDKTGNTDRVWVESLTLVDCFENS